MEEEEEEGKEDSTSSEGREGSQESGWTGYFEYFLKQGRGVEVTSSSVYEGQPLSTTVSDAASAAAQNLLCNVQVSAPSKACKRLEFKRRKAKYVLDEDIEDTASSPLSSPKVSGMNLDVGSCKKEENCAAAAENSSINRSPLQPEGRDQMLQIPAETEHTELKKRGLCLVPLSMLADYNG
ncbi:vascular-related unknown protein 4-like isoform X2 [Nymphaea colorata]|uniref:vascular-related unknown protein 4-like isoform X2 n=1 Tax=Nymphaea colorata TaxID=210225 RepID=UPI00129D4FBE|nr:vascular-related unknown protein 4-like isoform X2 [Nymphaea colorata]